MAAPTLPRRNQPRVRGSIKIPTGSSLPEDLRNAIERDGLRFRCSYSWVIVSALGAFYGIDVVPAWGKPRRRKPKAQREKVA